MIGNWYLEKLLRWLVIHKGNDSGAGGLHELHVRRRDVGSSGGVAEAAGGAVTGVAQDSDHRPVVEVRFRLGATRPRRRDRQVAAELTREEDHRVGLRGRENDALEDGDQGGDPNDVVWHVGWWKIEVISVVLSSWRRCWSCLGWTHWQVRYGATKFDIKYQANKITLCY